MVSEVITAASAAAAVGSAMTVAAAPESILACVDEAADETAGAAAVADMLAAMAAAAIAKGAVALPEVGGATGVSVTATVTGIAVAMAFVAVAASCCAEAAGSVEEPAADDGVAADFAVSDFELPDFALGGCGASELALEGGAAPEGGAEAEVFWVPEPLLVDGAAGAVFCDPPLVAAAGASSEGDCQAGGGGVAVGLLALLAALPSTSAPKISFPGVESDLAARGGAL
jgi:hypothetical protein